MGNNDTTLHRSPETVELTVQEARKFVEEVKKCCRDADYVDYIAAMKLTEIIKRYHALT